MTPILWHGGQGAAFEVYVCECLCTFARHQKHIYTWNCSIARLLVFLVTIQMTRPPSLCLSFLQKHSRCRCRWSKAVFTLRIQHICTAQIGLVCVGTVYEFIANVKNRWYSVPHETIVVIKRNLCPHWPIIHSQFDSPDSNSFCPGAICATWNIFFYALRMILTQYFLCVRFNLLLRVRYHSIFNIRKKRRIPP